MSNTFHNSLETPGSSGTFSENNKKVSQKVKEGFKEWAEQEFGMFLPYMEN